MTPSDFFSSSDTNASKGQQHPQYRQDRDMVNRLLSSEPTPYNLAELARLTIRYDGFPGAHDIQADLKKVLKQWHLTLDDLFEQTRQIHQTSQVYRNVSGRGGEDWS